MSSLKSVGNGRDSVRKREGELDLSSEVHAWKKVTVPCFPGAFNFINLVQAKIST